MQGYHSAAAAQSAQSAAYSAMPQEASLGLLPDIRNRLNACHNLVDQLQETTDHVLGVQPESGKGSVPSAVPNGMVDEISASLATLHDRLTSIAHRLCNLR